MKIVNNLWWVKILKFSSISDSRLHIHGKEVSRSGRKRKHGSENSSKSVQSRVLAKEHMSNAKNLPKRKKVDSKKLIHAKKFACKFCDKSYTQSHSLKTHMKKVHEGKKAEKLHRCQYPSCKAAFTQSHSLKDHIRRIHSALHSRLSRELS